MSEKNCCIFLVKFRAQERSVAHHIHMVFTYKVVRWMYTTFLSRMPLTFSIRNCVRRKELFLEFCLCYELLHLALRGCSRRWWNQAWSHMKLLLYFRSIMVPLRRTLLDCIDYDIISHNSFQVCLLWQIWKFKTGIFRTYLYIHFLLSLNIYGEMRLSIFSCP